MNARLKELEMILEPSQRTGHNVQAIVKTNRGAPIADEASYLSPARFGVSGKNALVQLLGGSQSRPWLISVALHSVLFLLLAGVVSHKAGSGDEIVSLNVSQPADDDRSLTTMLSAHEDRNLEELIDNIEPASPSAEHHSFKIIVDESSSISADAGESSDYASVGDPLAKFQQEFEGVGTLDGAGGHQNGQYAEFFGIPSQGTRFAFVIDCSRSMRGHKWTRACQELWSSLEKLGNEQEFFVVFFDQEPHLMLKQKFPNLSMLQANPENLTKVKHWGRSLKLGPNTFPMESLHCALSLKPDAIYLLSDGEFQDESVGYLRSNNRINEENGLSNAIVPIHTVAFTSEVGGQTLSLIATENDGQFRYVK